MNRAYSTYGRDQKCMFNFVQKPRREDSVGHKRVDDTKTDFKEQGRIMWTAIICLRAGISVGAFVNTAGNLRVP
jgi:hypothetical protein